MTRLRTIRTDRIKEMNTLRALVFVIYILGFCFLASGVALVGAIGVTNLARCKAAIYICLVFYVGGKVSF